ncbi:MAG: MFS transporter [Alphaproteobacteria bacterium]|nr:MFS transporter [Alphaproteobacteria bacterium]
MNQAAAAPPSPIRWLILAGVWLVYLCFGLTTVGLAPLVAPVTRDLGMSQTAMGTVLGSWQLVYIVAAVPCGALLDRLGSRRALFLGAVIIAASGVLRSLAWDFFSLACAVGLFGFGGPIVSAGAPKVIAQWFKGRERGLAMGIYITGPAVGSIIGLSLTNSVLMPLFEQDWRRVLQLWAGAAILCSLGWLILTSHRDAQRFDRAAAAAPRSSQREVIPALLALPAVRVLLAMSVGIFMFNHGLNNWLPELLRADGMTAREAGYWATVPTVIGILASLMIPRLATPERRLTILAALCVFAGTSSVLLHAEPGPVLLVGLVAQGVARSSLMTVAMLTLVETRGVGERNAGTAGGMFFSAAEIGGAGGPVVLGAIYDATGRFDLGLWLLTAIAALLFMGVMYLRRLAGRGDGPAGAAASP